ncbi:MAG: class I SAM-dependent methyltransferase [Panacagrimonas sp.]
MRVHSCPVCAGQSHALDVVDFNKSCEEGCGKYLRLSGLPVYYFYCGQCGFCFAPEIYRWSREQFREKIYNAEYVNVDPEYLDARPRANAASLIKSFPDVMGKIRHLDYGGGGGQLSEFLRLSGWTSESYDPFEGEDRSISSLGTFDLITAYEVFEHVPDISTLMSDLQTLLAPDGVVIFSTLLSDGHLMPNTRINWWYAAPRNGHISLFTRKSLSILAQQSCFSFVSLSSGLHAFWTQVPQWAARALPSPLVSAAR